MNLLGGGSSIQNTNSLAWGTAMVVPPGFQWLVHKMNVLPHPARGYLTMMTRLAGRKGLSNPGWRVVWLYQIGVHQTVLGSAGHVHGTLQG